MNPALFCDLYELTMAAAYHRAGIDGVASFELFVRSLPHERNFLVVDGVSAALDGLSDWCFDGPAIDYLRSLHRFDSSFLDALAGQTFTGSVRAVPDGDVVFAREPLLEITAPIIEGQLLETFLLNQVTMGTVAASKAARVALACGDRTFVDFSARRDHGIDAALTVARASFIAGAAATSLIDAGRRWGIPLTGTMAHAFVMAFDDERDAFRAYARSFPDAVVLLLDTYDTLQGARHVVEVASELAAEGIAISGVRLDSGDLLALSVAVRGVLDEGGLRDVRIFASGDLDEYRIAALLASGAPIDAFGVGTRMGTSVDVPYLSSVYKLVEDQAGPKLKLSEGKATLPGRKQVWRSDDHDVIALVDEEIAGARPLLEPAPWHSIAEAKQRCERALEALPDRLRTLETATPPYDVRLSDGLRSLTDKLTAEHRSGG